jgi:hypothetical protein
MGEPRRSERSIGLSEDGTIVVGDGLALEEIDIESNQPASAKATSTLFDRIMAISCRLLNCGSRDAG